MDVGILSEQMGEKRAASSETYDSKSEVKVKLGY